MGKHLCEKHRSNEGFIDLTGKWNCWTCYYSDPYNDPKGRIVQEAFIGDYYVRLVDRTLRGNGMAVEVFHRKEFVNTGTYRDLSSATRNFNTVRDQIETNTYSHKRRSFYSDLVLPQPRTELEEPPEGAPMVQEESPELGDYSMEIREDTIEEGSFNNVRFVDSELFNLRLTNCEINHCNMDDCIIEEGCRVYGSEMFRCSYHPRTIIDRECSLAECEQIREDDEGGR